MSIKKIEVEFMDNFTPPDKFDGWRQGNEYGRCRVCPFYAENDVYDWCVLLTDEPKTDICPIKKYFK
jgi:hypothetical protein